CAPTHLAPSPPVPIRPTPRALPYTTTLSLHDALPIYAGIQPGNVLYRYVRYSEDSSETIIESRTKIPPQEERSVISDTAERDARSEEHTSELQSREKIVCRLLLEKKKKKHHRSHERYD